MKYLIIGNSAAAVACIEGIRSKDKVGDITVLSAEHRHCYGRPLISYYLAGFTTKQNMNYRPDDFYDVNKVRLRLGVSALSIDVNERTVKASDGKNYKYDRLLVATGSRPFVPPADGLDSVKQKYTFMSFDDMEALEKACSTDKNVVIVGAGLIGLKCAEGILGRVKSITVVDLATRVMPSVTDDDSALIIKQHLENKGIRFILGDCAACYSENTLTLKSGKKLSFDILVTAAGVRPETSLVQAAGGNVNRGIIVDTHMRTSLENVYAAGDCTEGIDSSINGARVLALMPNAFNQGKTAGINMAGGDLEYNNAIPLNSIGFFGLHMVSAGNYDGDAICEKSDIGLKKLFIKDGVLRGFILVGNIERAGIYTSLVREKTPLGSVDIELIKKAPQLIAFDEQVRRAKLARRV